MKYQIPDIPRDVVKLIEHYQFIAFKQGSTESTILYWILEEIQNSEQYTSAFHWIENNIADLAIAIQTNRYNTI
jgi:hypothetical protein